MGVVIAQSTTGAYSTWAQLRCPLIGAYDQWQKYVGPGPQYHNLVIDSGFHPDEGLFVRVSSWPGIFTWFDVNQDPHDEYFGPIVGFADGSGSSPPADSFFSIGAYDANVNAENNPAYTSANNNLDQGDIDNGFVGLTVTYTTGTLTIDADALLSYPITTPWYGQNLGAVTITAVTDIDTFTAF